MPEIRNYVREQAGPGAGRFAVVATLEGELSRGELQPTRESTDTERAFAIAQQSLHEQRSRFITSSTTLVLDEMLKELEDRGDKVVSITASAAEKLRGDPEWTINSMLTGDGRNLVTGHSLDANSTEARVISMLECIGDDGAFGIPAWFDADASGGDFAVNLDQIRSGALELGVADGEEPRSQRRKELLRGIIENRELAGSEYTLAAAALISEGILAEYPDVATIRFRYEDGSLRALSVKDRSGIQQTFSAQSRANSLLNRNLDFSDLCALPIDANGARAQAWFNKPALLPSTWDWDLHEVQEMAEQYR